ncbi:MAG: chromate transporter [Eubacteriales bacterium]|nr:chromate transporter [Eubacteriales bacterium]MDD3883027.1 chromate transporter [Eubacteriales bacterium]MDD4513646.1 chromate transporter [Eubacteriales bacterium]
MIYLSLFLEFLKVGLFSFGGGYGAIPLIQDCVLSNGWLDEGMLANIIAVSESTPGPIMVNTATYVGSSQAGFFGALAATFGVVLPSFVIILLIAKCLGGFIKSRGMQAVIGGISPAVCGIILSTGIFMAFTLLAGSITAFEFDFASAAVMALLAAASIIYKKLLKKRMSPILLIVIAAMLGMIIC